MRVVFPSFSVGTEDWDFKGSCGAERHIVVPQFFWFSWWLFLLPGNKVELCLCPSTGIAPLAEDCLMVELSRSLGPVHGFYVLAGALVTAFPFYLCFSHLGLVFISFQILLHHYHVTDPLCRLPLGLHPALLPQRGRRLRSPAGPGHPAERGFKGAGIQDRTSPD